MKITAKTVFVMIALSLFALGGGARAADEKKSEPATAAHDHNHADKAGEKAQGAKAGEMGEGMMNGGMMDGDMMEMMHQCMKMHKDGKMCEHDAMAKCEEGMNKADCKKMMKKAKAKTKGKK